MSYMKTAFDMKFHGFFFAFVQVLLFYNSVFFLQFDASQIDYNEANHKKDQLNFILAANI